MLVLPIKRVWFDMIKSGEKKEEYREIKPYWTKRFYNNLIDLTIVRDSNEKLSYIVSAKGIIILKNGYQKNAPKMKCFIELSKVYGKTEWGAEEGKEYYILEILEILEVKNV